MWRAVVGSAGNRLIIEERLDGEEASVLAITDGRTIVMLPPAQDHKPAHDGDTGPNTGGKTLALKGAGLAALMTRMGLAIPCDEGTTVPLFDAIVADVAKRAGRSNLAKHP